MRVLENIYDVSLHHIGRTEENPFVVIIGAMDGVSFDETRGYISKYGWKGLFVEPVKEQFSRLELLYRNTGSICENIAISDKIGSIKMLTIDQEAIDSGKVHSCFGGMSAVYPPKNGLSSEGDREVVEKYGKIIEVPCTTIENLLTKHNILNIDIISIDTEGHDLIILKNLDIQKYNPKVIRIEYINLSKEDQNIAIDLLEKNNYVYNIIGQNLDAVRKDYWEEISTKNISVNKKNTETDTKINSSPNITLVTGIWDLGRDDLNAGWKRNFDHYITKFEELLKNCLDVPMIVFIDPKHENLVWKYRSRENTAIYHQTKEQFNSAFFPFFDQVQKIRNSPDWYNQVGWLKDSTQGSMEWYNPMVMSKMFMLHNAKCFNPFNTEYMFWIDGGITNTVHPGYFSHDKVLNKLENITKKMLFICFPYETTTEIHGFDISEMNRLSGDHVSRVARGGFFGGHIDYISEANSKYYELLNNTLNSGYMGTEESIFTIMTYHDPDLYRYESINSDGLISTFFENLKNNTFINQTKENSIQRKSSSNKDIILYINTFNSPDQLKMVLDSFEKFDKNFLNKTRKILINNSTDERTFPIYDKIINHYNFSDQIKKGNLGVCGGRQFAAEHFDESGSEYMMFFEDDMLLDLRGVCQFGFNKQVNNLFDTVVKIMRNESYDFLKFSFSEFYGNNGEQWSWHNVPSAQRIKYFGRTMKRPLTKFNHIKTLNNIPYAEGEIYYSNWPHIIDQEGNKKCFLDTKWDHPFEQTWMSHIYTLTIENKVKPAILLASPITHNRVHFYGAEERREN